MSLAFTLQSQYLIRLQDFHHFICWFLRYWKHKFVLNKPYCEILYTTLQPAQHTQPTATCYSPHRKAPVFSFARCYKSLSVFLDIILWKVYNINESRLKYVVGGVEDEAVIFNHCHCQCATEKMFRKFYRNYLKYEIISTVTVFESTINAHPANHTR